MKRKKRFSINTDAGNVEYNVAFFNRSNGTSEGASLGLAESKEDKQNFIDKFGQDEYDMFVKMKDRLKNNGISTDIVYHTAHTSKEEMSKILNDVSSRVVKNKETGKNVNNVKVAYEDDQWIIYDVLDWETAMNLGKGTGWCITGRYLTNGEVKPSQAEHYFNEYLSRYYSMYLFVMRKSDNLAQYCICPYKNNKGCDVWDCDDYKINYADDVPDFEYKGFKYYNPKRLRVEKNTLVGEAKKDIESYEVPEGVEKIDEFVFDDCANLKSIKLPDGLKDIGYEAFGDCRSLDNVVFPNSLKVLGEMSFMGCESLKKIVIPEMIETIKYSTFSDCTSLKEVEFPKSLKSIEARAFANCSSLEEIILPDTVESIGNRCFYGCKNLRKIFIPKGVSYLGEYNFKECPNLTIYYEGYSQRLIWDDDWNPDNRPVVLGCSKEKYLSESLNESKEDQNKFIDKFGEDSYEVFKKSNSMLKKYSISTDLTWHVKNTSVEEMGELVNELEDEVNTGKIMDSQGKPHMNVEKAFEDDKWLIYDVKDWQTAVNLGEGTVWCITGRYKTHGKVKYSQAKAYFTQYLDDYYSMYLFAIDKKTNEAKYCICPNMEKTNQTVWDEDDHESDYVEEIPNFEYNGFEYKSHLEEFANERIDKFKEIYDLNDANISLKSANSGNLIATLDNVDFRLSTYDYPWNIYLDFMYFKKHPFGKEVLDFMRKLTNNDFDKMRRIYLDSVEHYYVPWSYTSNNFAYSDAMRKGKWMTHVEKALRIALDGGDVDKYVNDVYEDEYVRPARERANESLDSSLEEKIEIHDTLNPSLWENDELKPEVKEKIEEVVDKFVEMLEERDIKIKVNDILILGSNASYNYNKHSDIDVHIISDTDIEKCPYEHLLKIYDAYRSLFNNKYDVMINGSEIELYVESEETDAKSNGIYSLNDGWIKKPRKEKIKDVDITKEVKEWEDRYSELIKEISED